MGMYIYVYVYGDTWIYMGVPEFKFNKEFCFPENKITNFVLLKSAHYLKKKYILNIKAPNQIISFTCSSDGGHELKTHFILLQLRGVHLEKFLSLAEFWGNIFNS